MTTDDKSYTPQRELRDLADHFQSRQYTAMRCLAFADHIDELQKQLAAARAQLAATRSLLRTAVDAWEDGAAVWTNGLFDARRRELCLSQAWYEHSRGVLRGDT